MQPPATPPPSANQERLTALVRRRRQLVEMAAMEKQRRADPDDDIAAASIDDHLAFLAKQIDQLDVAIAEQIEQDDGLARRAALLRTIPGIGAVASEGARRRASRTRAHRQETDRCPFDDAQDRPGRCRAHEPRQRPHARTGAHHRRQDIGALHPLHARPEPVEGATIVAIRCNPAIRPFYKHLRDQGKPAKVAIVAAMRKMLITANSMLEHDRPWINNPA